MSNASNWLKEERRKTLGDWVSVCLGCGFAQRYFEEWEADLPATRPQCEGEMRWRCPSCNACFTSAFTVECARRAARRSGRASSSARRSVPGK